MMLNDIVLQVLDKACEIVSTKQNISVSIHVDDDISFYVSPDKAEKEGDKDGWNWEGEEE